ncbi:D-alanyl-D-alanine carboxypeptidase family protein [Fredinandcohnia sp. 179-A 10B2 NHS]|uniref:D-alanyl-D-alanine carboxypeptidase family protein n=1 Tax=Fredinandcohnia sp. 179-A 10B2 NHS TaxID=3235176 RepID=UPI00399FE7A5
MKKILITVLIAIGIFIFFNSFSESSQFTKGTEQDLLIEGKAAVLLDNESGAVLYQKNGEERIYPASTTKIMTALLAVEMGNMDEIVRVGNETKMKVDNESTAWLVEGSQMNLKTLIAGMMLPSGNDAARTVAIHIAKKDSNNSRLTNEQALAYFAKLMNRRAKEIGATHSHFVNPHGLHDDNHYTTAKDLGIIAREAMKNATFREIVSEQKYVDPAVTYVNRNKLLDPTSGFYFEGANGIKTGFTDEAGYCLISSATRNGKEVVAIVLQSTDASVWTDSITLLEHGFTKLVATAN